MNGAFDLPFLWSSRIYQSTFFIWRSCMLIPGQVPRWPKDVDEHQ